MVAFLSQEWLDLLRASSANLPERSGASATLRFVVTGSPSGEVAYGLTIEDGRVVAARLGQDADADVTFTETYKDAVAIINGELDLHVGFMQGRVKFAGDMGALMGVLPVTQSDAYRSMLERVAAASDT